MSVTHPPAAPKSTWSLDIFTPKLVSVLREGYTLQHLRADAVAGLTVAIVALPLSMAIAIASHAPPAAGLYTAIVGGFLISALGGSRYQIGGPAGAFIVLLASIIDRHGMNGLLLATLMAGVMMLAIGAFRLGTFIKYVPHPVTVGFTAGIAVIIFASQIRDLLGLSLSGAEPAALLPKLHTLWLALPSFNAAAAAVAATSIGLILVLRRYAPKLPGFLIAVAACAVLAWVFQLPVETIGTRFGGVPRSLPMPQLPAFSFAKASELLPDAFAIALLGSIESLLSAVVADSMTGRRHRSNMELVAQGVANIGAAMFGGLTATGTIARTATNVRAGGHGPVSGMLHALFLLSFMLVAAPLLSYVPLAALAGILAIVSWNMAEKAEFKALLTATRGDAVVLLATFGLTIFRDLTEGIVVGVMMGSLLFMHRMATIMSVETHAGSLIEDDVAEDVSNRGAFPEGEATDPDIMVHRISGAFFFGTAATVSDTLGRIGRAPKGFVLDLSQVPFVDSSAAKALETFLAKAHGLGTRVRIAGASRHVRDELKRFGIASPHVEFSASIPAAITAIRQLLEKAPRAT